ncbi:MAG: hypothetical protein LQ340_001182 [Diploschistes diacapsis]|nr:MAG: hypothetical protein LQ340_001182 [Diploschistes diacapsis]
MSDTPPQLADLPRASGFSVPTLGTAPEQKYSASANANGSAAMSDSQNSFNDARDSAVNSKGHCKQWSVFIVSVCPQSLIRAGPVADAVKDQHAKTSAEFNNLANSRKMPETRAANDQPLTHYHSFFYTLLSWENPRVTGIAFGSIITAIFAFRYVPAVSWALKGLWITFGTVALVESAAKLCFGSGVAQSIRPRRYLTVPREFLEASLEDVEQLINFFVIEFQRVLYAENVLHTIAAFLASLLSYYLIRIVPFWGLSLIATSIVFLTPIIYITNQEFIDHHLANANDIMNSQSAQIRDLAGQHASNASNTLKNYAGDYTAKAQEMIGSATGSKNASGSNVKAESFPQAPTQEPAANSTAAEPQPAS